MEKRTPIERDRKSRFSDDADFSALEPTRRLDGTVRRSKKFRVLAIFFQSVVPVAYRRRPSRRSKQRKKTLSVFAKTPILTKQAAKKPAPKRFLTPLCATRRRERSGVLSSTVRPRRWARLVETPTRAYPNRFPDFLVSLGTNLNNAFFHRSRRTFRVRRRFIFEKTRSERNDFDDRQPLAEKAFILQRFSVPARRRKRFYFQNRSKPRYYFYRLNRVNFLRKEQYF